MRFKKIPMVTCMKCQGEGFVAMSDELEDTLKAVYVCPGITAPEMLDQFAGVGTTALNNRLEYLRRLGFVRREARGRAWRYFPVKGGGMWE